MATFNVEIGNTKRKDGRHNILIRITCDRNHKRKAMDIFVNKDEFNSNGGYGKWIRSNHPNSIGINNRIKDRIRLYESSVEQLEKKGIAVTGENIIIESERSKSDSILEFYEKEIEGYRLRKQYRTADKHGYILKKLKKYLNGKDLLFNEFSKTFLKEYHGYLRSELANGINTVFTDLKGIKTIFNTAIREGVIGSDDNPFIGYKIETEQTIKEKLTISEMNKIEDLKYTHKSRLWHVKSYFLFSYYCAGIRFSDMATLKWENVINERIRYRMSKNRKIIDLEIPTKAKQIIDYYRSNANKIDDFIFPILNNKREYDDEQFLKKQISSKNAAINKTLKEIARDATISKRVSFHTARHSFAFIAYKQTMDIDSISTALRHSNLEETKNYLSDIGIENLDNFMKRVHTN